MIPKPKQDSTRKADISLLNQVLYGTIVHIKDIAIQTQLMLAVMNALEELENEVHSH
jgi:hypothetical protein